MALILVIDDSTFQRHMIRTMVESAGHHVLEASNGREGLQLLGSKKPDCVLMDLIMPELNGFSMLKTFQGSHSKIPVVIVTADIQQSTYTQCLELGAVAVLNKPLRPDELHKTIQKALGVKDQAA